MSINLSIPENTELAPRITVVGVGGAGGNAVNNMINAELEGVDFVVCNTDAQAISQSRAERRVQLGTAVTQGLGAGAQPDVGRAAAEETLEELMEHLQGSNMVFVTAGMGGGTGTGAAPVIARVAREQGILTVGVVTKPFHFEGTRRMRIADAGIEEMQKVVDTLIVIPNQNLFRIANERTTFADAFKMADDVLYAGVRGVTDLMVMPGLINLDFADIRTVMSEMGKAMMGTGEGGGENRAVEAAEAAISNPLLDDVSMKGARGVLINITGGPDMTLFEVDEAANRIRDEVDPDANIIFGSTFDPTLEGAVRVSVVATGIDAEQAERENEERRQALEAEAPRQAPAAGVSGLRTPDAAPARQPAAEAVASASYAPAAQTGATRAQAKADPAPARATARAGGAPQAAVEEDSFIAPEPVRAADPAPQQRLDIEESAPRHPEPQTEATQADDAADGAGQPRRLSFLQRVTGAGRGRVQGEQGEQGDAQASAQPKRAPRLEPLDDLASARNEDDDLLEIPAFLRRQAN